MARQAVRKDPRQSYVPTDNYRFSVVPEDPDQINLKQLDSQLPSADEKAAEEDRQNFADEYFKALKFFRVFANIFNLFPIQLKNDEEGRPKFSYNPRAIQSVIFVALLVFILIVSIIVSLNTAGALMNLPSHRSGGVTGPSATTARAEEMFILKRNLAPLIIFLGCLFHVNVGHWNFHFRRKFAVIYLNFWPEALRALRVEAASGIHKTMRWFIGSYCVFLILMIILTAINIAPVTSGFPTLFVMLLFRMIDPSFHASSLQFPFRVLAAIFILYILICSKIYPILFIIKCKLLRNSFAHWNHRLNILLNKGEMYFPKEIAQNMTDVISFPDLFKSHVLLLDLLQGNDEFFAETIESYLASQISSIVMEMYYFARAQSGDKEFSASRSMDAIIIGLYLAHSLIFLCFVVISANAVNQEAMDGLEIVRRKGLIGKRSTEDLYFMLSMYFSYTGYFETGVTGAGYFVYNKTYFVVIAGAILTYFVILFQFSPPLQLKEDDKMLTQIMDQNKLIEFVESTSELFNPAMRIGAFLMDALELNSNVTLNGTSF